MRVYEIILKFLLLQCGGIYRDDKRTLRGSGKTIYRSTIEYNNLLIQHQVRLTSTHSLKLVHRYYSCQTCQVSHNMPSQQLPSYMKEKKKSNCLHKDICKLIFRLHKWKLNNLLLQVFLNQMFIHFNILNMIMLILIAALLSLNPFIRPRSITKFSKQLM